MICQIFTDSYLYYIGGLFGCLYAALRMGIFPSYQCRLFLDILHLSDTDKEINNSSNSNSNEMSKLLTKPAAVAVVALISTTNVIDENDMTSFNTSKENNEMFEPITTCEPVSILETSNPSTADTDIVKLTPEMSVTTAATTTPFVTATAATIDVPSIDSITAAMVTVTADVAMSVITDTIAATTTTTANTTNTNTNTNASSTNATTIEKEDLKILNTLTIPTAFPDILARVALGPRIFVPVTSHAASDDNSMDSHSNNINNNNEHNGHDQFTGK